MKTKYDWSDVPTWVKFIATDSTGNTYGYEGWIKPYIILDYMFVGGMVVSGDSESVQESLYYSLNKEYCYE